MPAIMGVGIAVTPVEGLTIEADVLQMNWSCFDVLGIEFTEEPYTSLSGIDPGRLRGQPQLPGGR